MSAIRRRLVHGTLASLILAAACGGNDGASKPPPGVPSVVFDIDGTLTPTPINIFGVRPDAARAVQAYVDKGYAVIYATARPVLFEDYTRNWLATNGFPDVPLYMATLEQSADPATYKTALLDGLEQTEDRVFLYGYGDSTTDFTAYGAVGIPIAETWALLRENETECQPGDYEACIPGYTDHLAYIESQPDVR
jgi:phosphatidate phosphatase PAH1